MINIRMIIVTLFGLILFTILILVTWCFINKPDEYVLSCVLNMFNLNFKKKKSDKDDQADDITDSPDENLQCQFEAEDIFNGMIFTKDGDIVTSQPNMTCADCTKYVYKDKEGKCYKFVHDPDYNADNYCLQEQTEEKTRKDQFVTGCKDMCTAQFTDTPCPF